MVIGLWNNEVDHFANYCNFELKKSDTKFWKAEIFIEDKLNA
jgi:hypothetical protein